MVFCDIVIVVATPSGLCVYTCVCVCVCVPEFGGGHIALPLRQHNSYVAHALTEIHSLSTRRYNECAK